MSSVEQALEGDIFSRQGLIAQHHDAYEYRGGQIEMAARIASAFQEKKHLIVEAGTGTGKTLAYLVPAINQAIKSRKRIVISTGTKNLQEQLMEKDIPFLQKVLPRKFSAAYMKGRGNYACLYRIHKADNQPILDGMDDIDHFKQVADWVRETKVGDRAELTYLPENLSFWSRINARGDVCIGQKCPDYEPCFITKMRARAEDADILIVNHHLFFADLSVRGSQFGKVIPDYSAVIFDEAHLIEDVAAEYFGTQVSNFRIDEVVKDSNELPIPDAIAAAGIGKSCAKVTGLSEQFWVRFTQARGAEGRYPLMPDAFSQRTTGGESDTALGEAYKMLNDALLRLETEVDVYNEKMPEAESVVRRIRQTRFDLDFIVKQADSNFVYWLERRGRGIYLQASPVDVSSLLHEKLFDKVDTCILTSATLSANGSFNFIRDRLGLDRGKTTTYIAPSSFDHEKQAILYLPKAMPDPRAPEFTSIAASEIVRIINTTQGHAFVLCTSNSSMTALFELVSARTGYPCLLQGTMSKAGLLDKFRATPNAVLFATSSFWQGVDVRGEQLSCVIIDKLPFAVPTDPVVQARAKFIDENGGRSFFDYSVPQAVISLKQGIGRLIRSRTDRGVIAILDPRLRTKSYGRDFLASLPRMRITDDISEIGSIFET
ncbi:MAG TPA: ATP-dependent DNA helicase [Pyrinomonadaceae bacterium]|jgi:ATP-dependent DNA helicase DinG|nr:ATP-dependent DNA helicase [Pyrinomonadaceae bacterium]